MAIIMSMTRFGCMQAISVPSACKLHRNFSDAFYFVCCSFSADSDCTRFFTINRNTSIIRTVGMLDREAVYGEVARDRLQCFVQYENTSAGIDAIVLITINVLDINDEIPHFRDLSQPTIREVTENVAAPTPLLRLEPIDGDSGDNGTVQFSIVSGDVDYFSIKEPFGDTSGTPLRLLFLENELDFETHNRQFNLTIRISDMGSPSSNTFDQQIVIVVTNSPDEPPTFPTSRFMFPIREDHPVGISHPFANITAANSYDVLGSIFYYLCEDSGCERSGPEGVILVNEVTGELYLNQSLEADGDGATLEYSFYVKAINPSTRSGPSVNVRVMVEDVNDNAPYFICTSTVPCPPESPMRMNFSTGENYLTDTGRRFRLGAHDVDRSANNSFIEYSYSSEPHIDAVFFRLGGFVIFGIDQMLDRESTPDITVTITASNNKTSPKLSSTAIITVHVEDLNDNAPTFTQSLYSVHASEGSPVGKHVAKVVAHDSDADENGTVSYSITRVENTAAAAAKNWFKINSTSGVISVAVEDIDYHAVQGVVVLNVTATDKGAEPLSSTTLVQVELVPAITFTARSYQAFGNYNLAAAQDLSSVYLEFQTASRDGVLLYHQGVDRRFSLALEDGRVVFRYGELQPTRKELSIADNVWYSVLLENTEQVSANSENANIIYMYHHSNCYLLPIATAYSRHGHHANHSAGVLSPKQKSLNNIIM